MKVKITDLMDLYEDENCPLKPVGGDETQRGAHCASLQAEDDAGEAQKVKQSKYPFNWKQALSLAAVLVLLVLGGFGVKWLMHRSDTPAAPGESSAVTPIESSSVTPIESRDAGWETLAGEEQKALSRFLSAFANQNLRNVPAEDLNSPGSLIHFAFVWRRNNDCESITVQEGPNGLTDTLTLEQINEVLDPLLGKTVELPENDPGIVNRTPGMDFDYSDQVGREAGAVFYRDGCFWDQPAKSDTSFFFALATERAPDADTKLERVLFRVYYVNYEYWGPIDMGGMTALSTAEADALEAEDKLILTATGSAELERNGDGYRLLSYAAEPPAPSKEPDTISEEDYARVNHLLTALAGQGITDLEADLDGEYELVRFVHLYCKRYNRDAIRYQSEGDESYETLSLDDVNGFLRQLFGRTVSPAEGTDYTALHGDNYYQHESYHDGCFWFPAADGEICTRFATGSFLTQLEEQGWQFGFVLCEADLERWPEYADWDQSDFEAIRGFQEEGKFRMLGQGAARFVKTEDGLRLTAYHVELKTANGEDRPSPDAPVDPDTEADLRSLFSDPGSWYSRALSSSYADPADADLYLLFYDGFSGDSLTDAELKALYGDNEEEYPSCGTDRLPADQMNEVLIRCFGLGLEETAKNGLSGFAYLPETGCYYHCHGDTNIEDRRITAVRFQADGTVLLTYEAGFWYELTGRLSPALHTVALRPVGSGQYQILSNLPGEWVTAEDLGGLGALFRLSGPQRAESRDADGTVTVRELRFGRDGEFHYREGDPDSEYSYWAWGQWWVSDDHSFHCAMCETKEDGNRIGPWYSASFACAIDGDELVLTQLSETGFRDDAPGTELRFAPAAEE